MFSRLQKQISTLVLSAAAAAGLTNCTTAPGGYYEGGGGYGQGYQNQNFGNASFSGSDVYRRAYDAEVQRQLPRAAARQARRDLYYSNRPQNTMYGGYGSGYLPGVEPGKVIYRGTRTFQNTLSAEFNHAIRDGVHKAFQSASGEEESDKFIKALREGFFKHDSLNKDTATF